MNTSERIGQFVKQCRKKLHMTQEQLTEKVGYKTRASINNIERGLCDIPPQKLQLFADVLGCNICELIPSETLFDKQYAKDVIETKYTITITDITKPLISNNDLRTIGLNIGDNNYKKELLKLESKLVDIQNEYDNKTCYTYQIYLKLLQQIDNLQDETIINNFLADIQTINTMDIKQLNELKRKYNLE